MVPYKTPLPARVAAVAVFLALIVAANWLLETLLRVDVPVRWRP